MDPVPDPDDLSSLLDDFHVRQVLHVTFGSALVRFGVKLKAALAKHEAAYYEGLRTHFDKHLRLLKEEQ
jgi:tagaturonate epimerase